MPSWGQSGVEDFKVLLEEPVGGETHSGIGNLRGWAFAEDGIDRIEIDIDGEYVYDAPYGGSRPDVGETYPDIEGADNSGYSLAFGYSNLSYGEHTITARAFDLNGDFVEDTASFTVVGFGETFIFSNQIVDATDSSISAEGDEIFLEDVTVGDKVYDLRLKWRTAEQGFEIIDTGIRSITDTIVVNGTEWAQVDLFLDLSWNDINATCPQGVCAGVLNRHDMTGWTWASSDDLNELFNYYVGFDAIGPGPDNYIGDSSEWAFDLFSDGWRSTTT